MMMGLSVRFYSFMGAILIYALAGAPTPDEFGLPELMMAGLLLLCVHPPPLLEKIKNWRTRPFWEAISIILILYGIVGAALGVLHGNPAGAIIRDLLAFLFMLLPFLIWQEVSKHPYFKTAFLSVILFLGFVFALRSLDAYFSLALWPLGGSALDYFSNAPTVLAAALLLIPLMAERTIGRIHIRHAFFALLSGLLLLVIALSFIVSAQRAALGGLALQAILTLSVLTIFYPGKAWRLWVLLGAVVVLSLPALQEIAAMMVQKTQQVGLNMRLQEWQAVWSAVQSQPFTLLFGKGWGAMFESPAVGGLPVTFTHGLLSSMLLKSGLVGACLAALYIGSILCLHFKTPVQRAPYSFACVFPILVSSLLYASFKSFDFGLVLMLSLLIVYRPPEKVA